MNEAETSSSHPLERPREPLKRPDITAGCCRTEPIEVLFSLVPHNKK